MGQTISERLEYLRKANRDRQWINDDLYRLLYKADLYILAYERIKSKPGNMTPGTDGETLDGFSMETIQTIIEEMRTEQFRFKPVRTTFIPKANGKMRRLGIPCVRDKVVQEAIRLIPSFEFERLPRCRLLAPKPGNPALLSNLSTF